MKLRPFELTLVIIFGALFITALILIRTYDPPADESVTVVGTVSIWGTLPPSAINDLIKKISLKDKSYEMVTYSYFPPEKFDEAFLNTLADQNSPDLLLLPHDLLAKHRSRLQPLILESFPERDFRSTYIDGADIFVLSDGIYGYPVFVDPLVMFWNRDIFASNGLLTAPSTWEEIVADIVPTITNRDFNRTIKRSALAMGEYSNIKNAFPILSLLLLQGGSALVTEENKIYSIRLNETLNRSGATPFTNAVTFFTNFSNTSNTLYSWNRSLPLDRDMFLSEDLAIYFGFASEGRDIETKNPNLSFDIAEVPQGAEASVKRTYGQFYSLMIPKAAKNKNGSFSVMQNLGSQENAKELASGYNMVPVYRSSIISGSNDIYGRIAYKSANYARGWLSPDKNRLDEILSRMIGDVNANRSDIYSATTDAMNRIQQIY